MGLLDATPEEFERIRERTKVLVGHHDAETLRAAACTLREYAAKHQSVTLEESSRILDDLAAEIASGA